jgi:PAS domain S-box-containing protein
MMWFDEAWRVLGVAPDALPATTAAFRALLHPDDAARMAALYEQVYVEPRAYAEEYRIQPAPGVVRWIRELAEARLDATGKMQLLVGTLQDVTDQVEAERRVRESEERLLRAQRAARVGAWEWDIVADRSYSTPDELELYGIAPDAETPPPSGFEDFINLVHPDDRERVRAANLDAVATRGPLEAEFRIMLPGGKVRWLLTKGDIIADEKGRSVRMVGVNIDITQRKEAEAALSASEERFRTMVSTIDDVFWIESRDPHRLIYVSPAFERLTGRTAEELYADVDVWLACIHPDDRSLAREAFRRVAEDGSFTTEYRMVRHDGEERWVRDRGYVVPSESGRVERTTGVATDITERRQAERQRDLLMRELVHRVKNTLAVVQSIARQTRLNTDTLEAFYEKFEARLVALSQVHDLLFKEGWQGASLADVIGHTLAPYGVQEDGTRRFDTEGPAVRLDPNMAVKLSMVFHELATNAMKYGALSTAEGRIAVAWERTRSEDGRDAVAIRWVERGGPPVTEPERRGFGTLLVERVAGRELGTDVTLRFAPAGVECSITLYL